MAGAEHDYTYATNGESTTAMIKFKIKALSFLSVDSRVSHNARVGTGAQRIAGAHMQHGLSLVELMVALVISSLILIGLVQIFASTRVTYQADEGLARLQESGRFAMDFLAREVRMAGYMGCLGKIPPSKVEEKIWKFLDTSSYPIDFTRGIEGSEAANTAPGDSFSIPDQYSASPTLVAHALPGLTTARALSGSDVLVLRYMDSNSAPLVPNASGIYHDSAQVFVGTPNSLAQGQIAIVTNCEQAGIFQITNNPTGGSPVSVAHAVGGTPGNTCPVWGNGRCPGQAGSFREGSTIAVFRNATYYIGRADALNSNVPSLRRITFDSGTALDEELVEGIENMQVLFGLDLNPDNDSEREGRSTDSYVTAGEVTDWTRVIGVRIGLLVATSNVTGQADQALDTSTYTVAGTTLDPSDDRRRRRVFTSVVQLRSR